MAFFDRLGAGPAACPLQKVDLFVTDGLQGADLHRAVGGDNARHQTHKGGEEEFEAVAKYLEKFKPKVYSDASNPKSPVLFLYSIK